MSGQSYLAQPTGNGFPRLGIDTEALRRTVESLLATAAGSKEHMGAVNWSTLRAVDIERRESLLHPGTVPYCVVMVEEAAPGGELQCWLNERIAEVFPNTYIECEW
jgi:hypothetical protein